MQISDESVATDEAPGETVHLNQSINTINRETGPSDILDIKVGAPSNKPQQIVEEVETIPLESINLQNLPLGWAALKKLGPAINYIKDSQIENTDLSAIKPPQEVYFALPMVASVIANKNDPNIPVVLPNKTEIKKMQPWLEILGRFIGRFSENLSGKFGRFIEQKGGKIVLETGEKIYKVSERIGTIKNPKKQFTIELANLYRYITEPQFLTYKGFWGEEVIEEIPMDNRIREIVQYFRNVVDYSSGYFDILLGDQSINPREKDRTSHRVNYPILSILIYDIINPKPEQMPGLENIVAIAAPEFLHGIEKFLRQQNISDIRPAPNALEFDFFNLDTWVRALAELFGYERLERVKNSLPEVLSLVHEILPKSGSEFSQKLYEIAENICLLKKQGMNSTQIAQNVFKN